MWYVFYMADEKASEKDRTRHYKSHSKACAFMIKLLEMV